MIAEQKLHDADIVIGTRYRGKGSGISGWTLIRKFLSVATNNFTRTVLDMNSSDITGAYRLYKREVLDTLMPHVKTTYGYMFQIEIIFRAGNANLKMAEIPITFVDRFFGESKLGSSEIISYLEGLWSLLTS